MDPQVPVDNEQHVDLERPVDPPQPVNDEQPAAPEEPINPEEPVNPEQPVVPEQPMDAEGAGDEGLGVPPDAEPDRHLEQGDAPPQQQGTQEFPHTPSKRQRVSHIFGLPIVKQEGEQDQAGPSRMQAPQAQNPQQEPVNEGEQLPRDREEPAADQENQ